MTLEETLDRWAMEYPLAAGALHALLREALKDSGYRHIGKALTQLEIPDDWHPEVYAGRKPEP